MYILSAQLQSASDATSAFHAYRTYIASVADRLPPGALALANSEWYHDFSDHRCPHDSWLEEFAVREVGIGPRQSHRTTAINLRLLGAYHDGHIEFRYTDVSAYRCDFSRPPESTSSHTDWRYDEIRLSDAGRVLHEIEWYHMDETAHWTIEAADVTFSWTPFDMSTPAPNER